MDREKVISLVEDAIEIVEKEAYWTIANGLRDALSLLKEQEAVVRCKDCKHFDGEGCSNGNSICYQYATRPDWYCADAERKEGR